MSLYYLLLFATPFHYDPRLGKVLFEAGIMIVTPVKLLGLLTAAGAFLAPPQADFFFRHVPYGPSSVGSPGAPRLRNPLLLLFAPFAIIPTFITIMRGLGAPAGPVGQLVSAMLLFVATRLLVRTKERMFKSIRTLAIAFAFGSLWVYKQRFLEGAVQPWGLEGDPNYEALMLLLSLPMALWMWLYDQSTWWRQIGLGCGLLIAGGVVLTESRAGIIAGGTMGLLTAVRTRHKLLGIALLAAAALLVFNYGPAGLVQRFRSVKFTGQPQNGDEDSTRIHVELLKAGLRMIESHPVSGVGLGQFKEVAPEYNPKILELADRSYIAHDTYIQMGAECGVPVLLLFIALLALALHNIGIARRSSDSVLGALAGAIQLSLVGISVAALSITAELLPFWILIFLSQNLREIAAADALDAAAERGLHSISSRRADYTTQELSGLSFILGPVKETRS
jgi:hypothetical protein